MNAMKTEINKRIPTPFETTQELLSKAIIAVNELSKHLESVPDKPRMYKANRALHVLWEIE